MLSLSKHGLVSFSGSFDGFRRASQKLLGSANIKLGQVASDVLGVSGRLMLHALAGGEQDAEKLAELAQGKRKSKKGELRRARWRGG
jgi:hypothetical protein